MLTPSKILDFFQVLILCLYARGVLYVRVTTVSSILGPTAVVRRDYDSFSFESRGLSFDDMWGLSGSGSVYLWGLSRYMIDGRLFYMVLGLFGSFVGLTLYSFYMCLGVTVYLTASGSHGVGVFTSSFVLFGPSGISVY